MGTPNLITTLPPIGLIMEPWVQYVALIYFAITAGIVSFYAIYVSYARRTWLPLLLLAASLFSVVLEPLSNIAINAMHPPVGQINAYSSKGAPVPVHIMLAYFSYFGSLPIFFYDRFIAQTMTRATWWKIAGVTLVTLIVAEEIPVMFGLWVFYGPQPMYIGPMPLWVEFLNTTAVILPALAIYRFMPILKGWRQLLVLGILPIFSVAGFFGAGGPGFNILGLDPNLLSQSRLLLELAGIVSAVFSALLIWMGITVACDRHQATE